MVVGTHGRPGGPPRRRRGRAPNREPSASPSSGGASPRPSVVIAGRAPWRRAPRSGTGIRVRTATQGRLDVRDPSGSCPVRCGHRAQGWCCPRSRRLSSIRVRGVAAPAAQWRCGARGTNRGRPGAQRCRLRRARDDAHGHAPAHLQPACTNSAHAHARITRRIMGPTSTLALLHAPRLGQL